MKNNKPNIKLRVYRRGENEMTLIYNTRDLRYLIGDKCYKPEVTIGKKQIKYYCDDSAVTNCAPGDFILYINYEENGLNSLSRYDTTFRFGATLVYNIVIEPKDIIPNLKDDKKMFTQILGYDRESKEWVKIPVEKDKTDNYHLKTKDRDSFEVLNDIHKTLLEIKDKLN